MWGPDQPEPAQPRHTADSITDDALTAARTRHLPDDIAIHYQNAVNAVVAAEQRAERAEARRAALKRAHVALAEQAGRNQAALDAVRKLHRPAKDWSWKTFGCNHDGAHAQSCGRCKTCHPCDTVRALDAHTTPTETT
ncbi:hypothetical protein ABGT92_23675 [Streptomyces cinereoruber]|uniref:hypothetical protein n=1 Tax=Streptomyces cinereoruber TaxID=67260 RepID=UPI00345CB5F4